MVPPYVERNVRGRDASISWWVPDAMMEMDRFRKKIQPPSIAEWTRQMDGVRIFRQLVYDNDPNQSNLLITPDWRIWMIDFSRSFRLYKQLRNSKELVRADRRLLARLRTLEEPTLRTKLGRWLTRSEIEAMLARRDAIVTLFDRRIAEHGQGQILHDLPRSSEPCGTGLV
jgi:hypothetical protein